MCYVDDVVIATPTLEVHIERLDEVFTCMEQAGLLTCKPSKCEILSDSIKYLGHLVDKNGVRPDPEAIKAVLTWKAPKTDTQLMSFLGFANYYREFIKGYADKIYPMQQLMRNKGKKFTWTDEAQVSFENINCEVYNTGPRHAYGEGDVCVRHGCISGCDIGHTSPGARVERENGSPSDSLRK